MQHWLVKQEPEDYSWTDFVKDGRTAWTGVRNFQARNNLRAMKRGDLVLYYHSGEAKEIVGIARVEKEAYPDATAEEGNWVCLDLRPLKPLQTPVPLKTVKTHKGLKNMALARQPRLSVMPLTAKEFETVLEIGETSAP
ncbi:MAG TPA: EVE domain-containing protein [Verrucomicrobiae bacterium]|nr:EVE domain-containing protein [Verrucomicrobiae bacterium]